ncbi:hypothetical protein M3172_25380 [Mesobacillus subterraneus]|uniref:hypothetical protein n=1 Tax=Mesobacillus subterraneus TaxID=285983 RepID=UPI00203FCA85|nr:hypothetical protein [Mesobacillus subterraneus]MCM3576480.1 hypothetical protein [Mesobacillus subterraneus]
MKKVSLMLSLFFLSIGLFGCQQNSEVKVDNPQDNTERLEQITFYPKESNSETLVIEDRETIELIKEAIDNAEKQPGIVNMADPEYRIVIGEETYFLWIDEKSGTIMYAEDTHTIYSLSLRSVNRINEVITYNYLNIREIAWNFLKEKGWNKSAKEEWNSATVNKIIVNEDYELLDKSYDGKEVLSISFNDKANVVVGTPIILVDANTDKVIGYMPGE